jgi:hypothetical protein
VPLYRRLWLCRALGVLRKPSVGPQLVYKFAPELLAAATQETVDFMVAAGNTCTVVTLENVGSGAVPPSRAKHNQGEPEALAICGMWLPNELRECMLHHGLCRSQARGVECLSRPRVAGAALDPRQLLPALVRFGEPDTEPAKREQVLKYVAFAMEQLRCTDRWVKMMRTWCPQDSV